MAESIREERMCDGFRTYVTKTDTQWMWEWPEFKAFAERAGIDLEKRWRLLVIRIPYDDAVTITQEYLAND